jgi:hypothetical protein
MLKLFLLTANPDNYFGHGLLKSVDGGDTWTLQGKESFDGAAFYRIVVHPLNADIAFAATSNGFFRTINGGSDWVKMMDGLPPISSNFMAATDVVMDSSNSDNMYVAFWGDGIYHSTNAITTSPTWNKLTTGLPSGGIGRIALGISPSFPEKVYALISNFIFNPSSFTIDENINGLYQTVTGSGGNTWNSISLPSDAIQQGFRSWALNVVVDPTVYDIIYLSGINLYKGIHNASNDTWSFFDIGGTIHPDHHDIF